MKQFNLAQLPFEAVSHDPNIQKKVMLTNGSLPHLTQFAQVYFTPQQTAPAHIHKDMNEVFFVLSGCGEIVVDQTPFSITPGTCFVVEAGESHEVRNTGKENLVMAYFGIKVQ